jgi:NAD(P)H-flavin reductase
MLRVQIPVRSAQKVGLRMTWHPGQHIFIRFLTLGPHALTNHPFSICSLPPSKEKHERCEIVLFIKPSSEFTARLAAMARSKPGTAVPVLLDGPYGGLTAVNSLVRFDRAVIIAGGAGAGYTLPIIEDILYRKDFDKRGLAGRVTRIQVVLALRSVEMREWYLMEMQRLLYRYVSAEFLKVAIYMTAQESQVSQERAPQIDDWTIRSHVSISSSLVMLEGRPDIDRIVVKSSVTPFERVVVVTCGPPSMTHAVREAAAKAQLRILKSRRTGDVYLHTEMFEW